MNPERRLRLFIYARILVAFLFLASTIVLNLQEPVAIEDHSYFGVVRLMAFSFIFSLVSLFFLRFRHYHVFITYLQTIWDLLFVTVLLLFTDGVSSPYSFLYLLSIMNAGVLLGRRDALYTASLCGILYGAIIDFQYFGMLGPIGLSQAAARQAGALHILYNLFMNLIGFYLTAVITGHLSKTAMESEAALQEKTVNYDELQRLNSSIVSNVDSGLLTITPDGRIRVFNRYAEMLTGKSQKDMYNEPLKELFPAMAEVVAELDDVSDGEFVWESHGKVPMSLGYTAVPFVDYHGDRAGVIINFKDLTVIKQMEEALKKRDRLASLGELSARMAHEIRNPLASISGSVQMLSEHGVTAESDQRLLAIILREAGRLNTLITEFLEYARPPLPRKERVYLRELIDELLLFSATDGRFAKIERVNLVPAHMTIMVDPNQFHQVLLNLLHNAAEAISASGEGDRIEIEAHFQLSGADGYRKTPVAVVSVCNNGPAIPADAMAHLFEPFWTTKREGTGLGLAIIYRIVEGHGGTIRVETPAEGGCRFLIILPV